MAEHQELEARLKKSEDLNIKLQAEIDRLKQDVAKLRNALRIQSGQTMATKLKDALRE